MAYLMKRIGKKATYVPLLVQDEPNERGTPPVKTDAYMYEDGTNLYVGFIAYDPEPDQIRASLRDRDTLWQDEHCHTRNRYL